MLKTSRWGATKSHLLRIWPAILVLGTATITLASGAAGATKHRHHHDSTSTASESHHSHRAAAARAAHLKRLAAQEKAAWRMHLAKVRVMPRSERLALKRHERHVRLEAKRDAEQAAETKAARHRHHHADQEASTNTPHHRRHSHSADEADNLTPRQKRIAARKARLAREAEATEQTAHERRLARQLAKAHEARLAKLHAIREAARVAEHKHGHSNTHVAMRPHPKMTAHERRLAKLRTEHDARLAAHFARAAKIEAVHEARLRAHARRIAEAALRRNSRDAKIQAERNAKLAAAQSHYVALHGDNSAGRAIKFWQTVEAGVPVKVITVDLNDPNVKVSAVMARKGDGTSEPFHDMIDRADPNVAVTGTFFSLDNLKPVGDIVVDGSLVHFGGMGTALCVTPNNRAEMVTCQWGRHHDWRAYDFVCACGPRLLHSRKIVLDPHAERFKDRHMLSPNSRIAVGITASNKLVFAMTREPIYLGRLAKVMQAMGCSEAMNLDAGTSTGFYYNGTTLAKPGRKLTNMIVVYGRRSRYEHALEQLVPHAHHPRVERSADRQVSKLVSN